MISKTEIEEESRNFKDWLYGWELNGVKIKPNVPEMEYVGRLRAQYIFDGLRRKIKRNEGSRFLEGLRVLDVGCNEGLFSITAKKHGADFVLGIEPRKEKVEQARFIARASGVSGVEFRDMNVYDITEDLGKFDVVLFVGLLYLLDRPFEALQKLSNVAKNLLVVETELLPFRYPLLAMKESFPSVHYSTCDSGLSYIPTEAGVRLMLQYCHFGNIDKIPAKGKEWTANSYTRHFLTGHRAAFIAQKVDQPIEHRLWPKGTLHPPNRVHTRMFQEMPGFFVECLKNWLVVLRHRMKHGPPR